jgi:hypothetical protein
MPVTAKLLLMLNMQGLAQTWLAVRERIARAADNARRDPPQILLLALTKGFHLTRSAREIFDFVLVKALLGDGNLMPVAGRQRPGDECARTAAGQVAKSSRATDC